MNKANIQDLKIDLAKFVKRIEAGETIVLCKRNVPIAEIRPYVRKPSGRRAFGKFKGWVQGDIEQLLKTDLQTIEDFEAPNLNK